MICRAGHLRGAASVAVIDSPTICARQVIAEALAEFSPASSSTTQASPLAGGAAYVTADLLIEWLEASGWCIMPLPLDPRVHECDCCGSDPRAKE